MINRKRAFIGAAMVLCTSAGLYAYWVWTLFDRGPIMLTSCVESDPRPVAWHCRRLLQYAPLQSDHVRELNLAAGIRFATGIKDRALAREVAESFIRQGVDINAPDDHFGPQGYTALHAAAISPDLDEVRLLLQLGARVDVKDREGRTPLQLARHVARRHPDQLQWQEMVALLERAETPAGK